MVSDLFPAARMTPDEARECVDAIKASVENIRLRALELYERQGWRALGYGSWRECVVAEIGQSQRHLYRQLQAALIEQEICPMGQIGQIPERQLRPLVAVPEGQRKEVWDAALASAPNGKPTARQVEEAAEAVAPRSTATPKSLPDQQPLWAEEPEEEDESEIEKEEDTESEGEEADDEDEQQEEESEKDDTDNYQPPVYPAGTMFVCEQCKEVFNEQVWHCPKCDHHWLTCESECKNCRSGGRYYEYGPATALAQATPELTAEDMERLAQEQAADQWVKIMDQFCRLATSIQRRGGMAQLAARWPADRLPLALAFMEQARETFDEYASILRGLQQ